IRTSGFRLQLLPYKMKELLAVCLKGLRKEAMPLPLTSALAVGQVNSRATAVHLPTIVLPTATLPTAAAQSAATIVVTPSVSPSSSTRVPAPETYCNLAVKEQSAPEGVNQTVEDIKTNLSALHGYNVDFMSYTGYLKFHEGQHQQFYGRAFKEYQWDCQ
ncbi:hypothetical protein BX616_001102, partial [Lobosporangium transversale]